MKSCLETLQGVIISFLSHRLEATPATETDSAELYGTCSCAENDKSMPR